MRPTTPVAPTMRPAVTNEDLGLSSSSDEEENAAPTMRFTTPVATTMRPTAVTNLPAMTTKRTTKTSTAGVGTVHTTSQAKVTTKALSIKKGCRVGILRKRLITFLTQDCQRVMIPTADPDNASYYGTVMGGSSRAGYNIRIDILPHSHKIVTIKRPNLYVMPKHSDEPLLDPKMIAAMEEKMKESKEKAKSEETKSEETFLKMEKEAILDATTYTCRVNSKDDDIIWKILRDDEHVLNDTEYNKIKDHSKPTLENFDYDNKTVHENFFEHMWPDMAGSAAIVDEYLANPKAEYHQTACDKNVRFHDPNADDPDWKTKQCILALIAAASEIENGMDCWKSGKGLGRKYYPDFGQWVSETDMKCFVSCCAFIWADKKWWFCERRDVDWDAFMPTIDKWNRTRTKLCLTFLLMMDEAMSGWKPKNTKRGGLPNITYEPRKPVDMGTMLRNAAECITGMVVYVDPVMCSERQGLKQHSKLKDPTPHRSTTREVRWSRIVFVVFWPLRYLSIPGIGADWTLFSLIRTQKAFGDTIVRVSFIVTLTVTFRPFISSFVSGTSYRLLVNCCTNHDDYCCPRHGFSPKFALLLASFHFQEVPVHVAEVLRQVQNSQVQVGGWTGGDAWFGSVCTCVTLKLELEVESTFVVKNHTELFPKRVLQAILSARHPDRPAGHWVVMTTEICGVKLLAIAYAWSQSSTAFFISTVGTTVPAEQSYMSSFENEYGETQTKLIPRPDIIDFIYRFLPIIDNHNKSRQHLLALEKKWPTKNCWFRLYTTLVGFSVVDLYRAYRFHDENKWAGVTMSQFSDMLCNGLIRRERTVLPVGLRVLAPGIMMRLGESRMHMDPQLNR